LHEAIGNGRCSDSAAVGDYKTKERRTGHISTSLSPLFEVVHAGVHTRSRTYKLFTSTILRDTVSIECSLIYSGNSDTANRQNAGWETLARHEHLEPARALLYRHGNSQAFDIIIDTGSR